MYDCDINTNIVMSHNQGFIYFKNNMKPEFMAFFLNVQLLYCKIL